MYCTTIVVLIGVDSLGVYIYRCHKVKLDMFLVTRLYVFSCADYRVGRPTLPRLHYNIAYVIECATICVVGQET